MIPEQPRILQRSLGHPRPPPMPLLLSPELGVGDGALWQMHLETGPGMLVREGIAPSLKPLTTW